MMMTRRHLCGSLLAATLLGGVVPARAVGKITVVDMAGRSVELAALPKRIVLLEAHDLLTMSLLHPDPASLVVGWAATDRIDSETLKQRLQGKHRIEVVGKMTPETVSLEGLIALAPDLVVTTAFMTPPEGSDLLVDRLQELGVPVLFSDTSSNTLASDKSLAPLASLEALMHMWGAILGTQARAEAYLELVRRSLADVASGLAGSSPVTTYLEVQSTTDDCCWAAGRKIWGELLAIAGGAPLPAVQAPWFEKLSLEYLLSTPHDVYIASGGGWAAGGRPSLGPGIMPDAARLSLKTLVEARPAFQGLSSVQHGRVHAVWTGLITNPPLHILFVAQLARWLHPDRFPETYAAGLLDTINRDFAAVPIDGPLWTSL
jgi:iron complex transport system substrate-binding protein